MKFGPVNPPPTLGYSTVLQLTSEELVTLLQEGVKFPKSMKIELTDIEEPVTMEDVASVVIPVMMQMPELAHLPVSELRDIPLGMLRRDNVRCFGKCRWKNGRPIMLLFTPIDDYSSTLSKLREEFPDAVIEHHPEWDREDGRFPWIQFQKGFQGNKVEFWHRLVSDEVRERFTEDQLKSIIGGIRLHGGGATGQSRWEGHQIDRTYLVCISVSKEGLPNRSQLGPKDVRRIDLDRTILTPEWFRIAAAVLHHEYLHALGFTGHGREFRALERLWPDEEARGGTPTQEDEHSLRQAYYRQVMPNG